MCGHELRPAGVHGCVQVAAIETAVWMSALSIELNAPVQGLAWYVACCCVLFERWYLDIEELQTHHIRQFLVFTPRDPELNACFPHQVWR